MDRSRLQVLGCARLVWLRLSRWGFGNPRHQPRTRNGRWGAGGSQGLGLPAHSVSTCRAPFLLHPAAMAAACTSGAAAQKNLRERERGSAVPAPLPRPGGKSRSLEDRNGHRVSKAAGGGRPQENAANAGKSLDTPSGPRHTKGPRNPGERLEMPTEIGAPKRTRAHPGDAWTLRHNAAQRPTVAMQTDNTNQGHPGRRRYSSQPWKTHAPTHPSSSSSSSSFRQSPSASFLRAPLKSSGRSKWFPLGQPRRAALRSRILVFLGGCTVSDRVNSAEGPCTGRSRGAPSYLPLATQVVCERCVAPRGGAAALRSGPQGRCGQRAVAPPGRNDRGPKTAPQHFNLAPIEMLGRRQSARAAPGGRQAVHTL
jgi:hypothetical protein